MDISLTREHEAFINRKIREGKFHSASDVVREAMGLLEEQEQLRQIRIGQLRREVAQGLASLERGEGIDGDEVFAELRRRGQQRDGTAA